MSKDNWIHRSDEMICRYCMWFNPKTTNIGRCRKKAPTLNGWPVTYETDWCGDHKLNEIKIETKILNDSKGRE